MPIKHTAMNGTWVQVESTGGLTLLQNLTSNDIDRGTILIADSATQPADFDNTFKLAATYDMLQFTFGAGVWAYGEQGLILASGR